MKLWHLFVLLVVMVFDSCMWGVPNKQSDNITKDTLVYTYQIIKQRAADCGNKPDSGCTVVNIKYPVFKNQQLLNDSIKNKILSAYIVDEKPDTSITQLAAHFLASYLEDVKPENKSGVIYRFNINAVVARQDSSIVTLKIVRDSFSGGAHGSYETLFMNWDSKSNKPITLADIFINEYNAQLTKVADSIFRKDEKLSYNTSLAPNYFFKNGKFSLNNNFLITPTDVRFMYNEYEIKPYSAGQTKLLVPYNRIKYLLRPHTVVSQYIK